MAVVVFKDGRRLAIGLTLYRRGKASRPPPSKEQVLAAREKKRRFYEDLLAGQIVLFRSDDGPEMGLSGKRGREALHVLVSASSAQEKAEQLGDDRNLGAKAIPALAGVDTNFKATPQLRQRLAAWEAEVAEEERRRAMAGTVRDILSGLERDGLLDSLHALETSPGADPLPGPHTEDRGAEAPARNPRLPLATAGDKRISPIVLVAAVFIGLILLLFLTAIVLQFTVIRRRRMRQDATRE